MKCLLFVVFKDEILTPIRFFLIPQTCSMNIIIVLYSIALIIVAARKMPEKSVYDNVSSSDKLYSASQITNKRDAQTINNKQTFYKVEMNHVTSQSNTYAKKASLSENYKETGNFRYLQNKSRGAEKVVLPFQFPYYSSLLSSLYITTEGFLSMGTALHSDMHHYAYVAPLLANFIPSPENGEISFIKYSDFVTFKWNNMLLEAQPDLGKFSFSCSLYRSGHIVFDYKDIPMYKPFSKGLAAVIDAKNFKYSSTIADGPLKNERKRHGLGDTVSGYTNVTVGISDSSIHANPLTGQYQIKSREKISVNLTEISSGSEIVFTPKWKCHERSSCFVCLDKGLIGNCNWCAEKNSCFNASEIVSSGPKLKENHCISSNVTHQEYCIYEERTPPNYLLKKENSIMPYYEIHWVDHEIYKRNNLHFWDSFRSDVKEIPIQLLQVEPFPVRLAFSFAYFNTNITSVYINHDGSVSLDNPVISYERDGLEKNGNIGRSILLKPPYNIPDLKIIPIAIDLHSTPASHVFYSSDSNSMWIQWNNQVSTLFPNITFTYRITILKNGAISFAYDEMLIPLSNSKEKKVGLYSKRDGDTFLVNLTPYAKYIHGKTEIVFLPRTTCFVHNECTKCINFALECNWDSKLSKCYNLRSKNSSMDVNDRVQTPMCPTIDVSQHTEDIEQITTQSKAMPHSNRSAYDTYRNKNQQPSAPNSKDLCTPYKSCQKCMQKFKIENSSCFWCHDSNRCFDGHGNCEQFSREGNTSWHPVYMELLSYGLTISDYCSYENSLKRRVPKVLNFYQKDAFISLSILISVILISLCLCVIWYARHKIQSNFGRFSSNMSRKYTRLIDTGNKWHSEHDWQMTSIIPKEDC